MKRFNFSRHQTQKPSGDARSVAGALNQNESNSSPAPDEVARRAYLAYENQGSPTGHDVQHWLDAEADLTAERNRTRVHGFPHRS